VWALKHKVSVVPGEGFLGGREGEGTALIVDAAARVASGGHGSVASGSAGASSDVIPGMFVTESAAAGITHAHSCRVCCSSGCSWAVVAGE